MGALVLPGHVRRNMMAEVLINRTLEEIPYWNRELKQIDERLELVWIDERAPRRPGMIPARWAVRRDNSDRGAPDSYMSIIDRDGSYRPMGSDIIEEIKSRDTWNSSVAHQIFVENERRKEREAERDRERFHEGMRDELAINLKAKIAPSTLVNTSVPWTNTAKGRRGRSR